MTKRSSPASQGLTYPAAGVDSAAEEQGLHALLQWVNKTHRFRKGLGQARIDIGYFASVIDIGHGMGLAITTDGVGTKLLVAQMVGKYDTVGIDCVAMNVNDLICVGATPLSMVDCLTIEEARPDVLEQIGKGLYEGAQRAHVNIVGGEIAQARDMVKGYRPGLGFDLTGTCVGTVPLEAINIGQDVREGDIVIGLRSTGVHSNGLTLARKALFEAAEMPIGQRVPDLGRSLGEELLEPTAIYVDEASALQSAGVTPKALANITGDGLLNLGRVAAPVGYVLDSLPEAHPIFHLIQRAGNVPLAEMFRVFNMGVGFCVVVGPQDVDRALHALRQPGLSTPHVLGHAVADREKRVRVPRYRLVGSEGVFRLE